MGIYDRDYYRKEGPSFLGSFTGQGRICKWIIAINVIVFVSQLLTRPLNGSLGWVTDALILDVDAVVHGQVWRLLTHAFLHDPDTLWHILWNMVVLWFFGKDVEDLYGPREFLALYLVAAVMGGVAYTAWQASMHLPGLALGASGAVTGVLVVFAFHYPTRVIYVFMLLPVPIWLFVIFNVAKDFYALLSQEQSHVAVAGHLGGAVFGYAYYKSNIRLLNFLPSLRGWQRRRSQPRLRVYHEEREEPVSVAAPSTPDVDEHLEAKMDAVLEKVKRSGLDSLTENERQILVRASEVYRRKKT